MSTPAPATVFIFGLPGAGKGTICKRLASYSEGQVQHISVGDLKRAIEGDTTHPHHSIVLQELNTPSGRLSAGTIIEILKKKMYDTISENTSTKCILIDGFPRDQAQKAEYEKGSFPEPTLVLSLQCSKAIAEARFLQRKRLETDNAETFAIRYGRFVKENKLLEDYYEEKGVLQRIDAEQSMEEVWIKTALIVSDKIPGIQCLNI